MEIFWHRRDPRIHDNAGLTTAAKRGPVLPVFVYDTELLKTIGARQRALYFKSLRRLKAQYRARGSDLLVRSGSPAEVLPEVAAEYGADRVVYNDHYRPARRNREKAATEALETAGIDTTGRTDLVLVAPGRLAASYPNHSQFYNDWQDAPKLSPFEPPGGDRFVEVSDATTVPDSSPDIELPQPGYEGARERLDTFIDTGITSYNDTRDDLAAAVDAPTAAVSRMSPYIAVGAIGIREVWAAAGDVYAAVHGAERRNVDKYRYELSWREHNYHLLYHTPDLAVSNYKSIPNQIEWRDAPEDFEAWTDGQTGYPLVDAGMRQLNQEGYIHNRPRQVVASFLTKHLLIDWRKGARYFTKQLIDHDYASNHGNWQWIASTGTDSVDVRIFDPVSQLAKYDDGARYVKTYVPELRDVPAEKIVDWPTLSTRERDEHAPEYAAPIVDRNHGYDRAQRVFERALGKR